MCKQHVDGGGRVSDSRDQNISSQEREGFCYTGDFIAAVPEPSCNCRHDVSEETKATRINAKYSDYPIPGFYMINRRLVTVRSNSLQQD